MSRKMLINATHPEENRVAIVEDGILTELDIEVFGREQTKGNIYKAVVVRVEPGLQAAFVDYGGARLGFLQTGELHECFYKAADPDGSRKGKLRINDLLRRGQEILVQVVKGERGTKGAALTTLLSLAGRYMVLMPDSDSKGVSRKIEEESVRKKLKSTMNSLDLPENMGYIVRTAGIDQSKEELRRDFDYLVRVYENILTHSKRVKAPALIYKESNLVIRSIRDYFTPDIDEVLVDDPKVMQEAKEFFQQVMPECVKLVKLHTEKRPIFSRYQIEEQIETIHKNKVPLPSGGSIVIDRTEALVAIDVNSGKMSGEHGVESTAYKTNLEAAEEAARQLRLRDLGGLIVIDFIDMRDRKHAREVEKLLKDALKHDKAKVTVGKISSFGLLEMTRQRIKDALAEGTFLTCPHCDGSGRIKSPEAQAVSALRKIQAAIAKGHVGRIEAELPLEVATYLLNARREELLEMERRHQIAIVVRGITNLFAGQVELTVHKREQGDELYLPPVTSLLDAAEAQAVAEESRAAVAKSEAAKTEVKARQEESHDETSTDGDEGGKKKRKRRRKKKGSGGESDEAASAPSEAAGADATADESPEAEEEATDATTEAEASSEGGKRKRKRRRKKKKAPGAEAELATGDTEATTPAIAVAASEATGDETVPGESGKKKRKRRRRKKGAGHVAATGESAATAEAPDTASATASNVAEMPGAVEATRPKRPRRAAKPVEPTPQATAETITSAPAKRTRKAPASVNAQVLESPPPSSMADRPATSDAQDTQAKPKRRSKAKATGEAVEAEATPKKRPMRKKAPEDGSVSS